MYQSTSPPTKNSTLLKSKPECLTSRLQALGEKVAEKNRQQSKNGITPPQPQKQLPSCPDTVRTVPNTLLRSSLFTVSRNRDTLKSLTLLASTPNIEVRFMGVRLNQTDLDTWEAILHLARLQPLGEKIHFSAHSLLKALGRHTSGTAHNQLKEEIARLRGGTVEITWVNEKKVFIGGLIENAYIDTETQQYVVVIDEKIHSLYENGYSHINWQQRLSLKNNLAKWLHGYYASHAEPHPHKVKTLLELCGSNTKELWKFRQMLRKSLNELLSIGAITKWEITPSDLVSVSVTPSSSQKRHIKNKGKTP